MDSTYTHTHTHTHRSRSVMSDSLRPHNIVPIKITALESDKLILKFIWKIKGRRRTKTILKKKKNKFGGLKIPEFKAIAKLWELRQYHQQKDRQIDQWNRITAQK